MPLTAWPVHLPAIGKGAGGVTEGRGVWVAVADGAYVTVADGATVAVAVAGPQLETDTIRMSRIIAHH